MIFWLRDRVAPNYADVPILVPCFNAVSYARGMTRQLQERGYRNIVLLDNASSYPPMLDFLGAPGDGVTVVRSNENRGPRYAFLDETFYASLPKTFCLTDPDLVFGERMPADFVGRLIALTEARRIGKAGLALDIFDRASMRDEDFLIDDEVFKIWEWEARFWRRKARRMPGGDPIYHAQIDTTFAVYNKDYFDPRDYRKAVRVAGRYTCRHLPWYKDVGLAPDELAFYRRAAKMSYYLRDDETQAITY